MNVADRLPRYYARPLSGWAITEASVTDRRANQRKPPTVWQVQDAWNCWRVVEVMTHDRWAADYAEQRADDLNFHHEQWLLERGLL